MEELRKCESPITRPLRKPAFGGHGGRAVELKASSRQLAGGAHGTFHVVGAGRICQPPALHKPLVPPARGSYPAPRGLEHVARDPGAAPEVAARLVSRETAPRESYTGRSQAAMFGEASLLGARVYWAPGWPVLSFPVPSVEEMKGVEIKYSARSRSVE